MVSVPSKPLEARRRAIVARIEKLRAGQWWHVRGVEEAEGRM